MRLILFTGKGGVGKTSVAAATALLASQRGYRTVVLSLDLAHSLSDAFDVQRRLMDDAAGQAVEIAEKLWIQEMDVQEEIRLHWGEIHNYLAALLNTSGLDEIVSEEIAHLPGMAEAVGLLYVNKYFQERSFELAILDCAPTGESLRFLSMPTALEWYMNKVFRLERNLMKVARPVASLFSEVPLPSEDYFAAVRSMYRKLEGVQGLLEDSRLTSARLVTNPEKMVVRESQRAFMYMSLYGLNVDLIVANRFFCAEVSDAYFGRWKEIQSRYLREIEDSFSPVPVRTVDLFRDEVVGPDALRRLGECIYGGDDPCDVFYTEAPYRFAKEDGAYKIFLKLPFVDKEDVELSRSEDQLIVRIGSFKRHVTLPRSMIDLEPVGAQMEGNTLCVRFGGDRNVSK